MARILQWLFRERRNRFEKKFGNTLRISESDRYGPLIDLQGSQNRIPAWFARFIAWRLPSSDLWILLDPDPAMQPGEQKPKADEVRQRESFRAFVRSRRNHVVLDASDPPDCLTERAYGAIMGTLAERAERALAGRL
jgi:hypothetical protein